MGERRLIGHAPILSRGARTYQSDRAGGVSTPEWFDLDDSRPEPRSAQSDWFTGGGTGKLRHMADDPRPQLLPGQATRARTPEEQRGPGDVGVEPDPRFTFANERTFLAWNRTALGLIAAGAAAAAFLRSGFSGARLLVALPLIVLGAALAGLSFRNWDRNERAMRLGQPLPYTEMPRVLAVTVAVVAALTAVLAVVDLLVS